MPTMLYTSLFLVWANNAYNFFLLKRLSSLLLFLRQWQLQTAPKTNTREMYFSVLNWVVSLKTARKEGPVRKWTPTALYIQCGYIRLHAFSVELQKTKMHSATQRTEFLKWYGQQNLWLLKFMKLLISLETNWPNSVLISYKCSLCSKESAYNKQTDKKYEDLYYGINWQQIRLFCYHLSL